MQNNKPYVYDGIEFPPDHYFFGQFVVFTGRFERDTRDLKDKLFFECGGIPFERLAGWVKHVVVGYGTETELCREAKQGYQEGHIIILDEQEFIDTLDGKYTPPENPNKRVRNIKVWEADGWTPEREAAEHNEFLARKRDDYLRKRKPSGNKYDVWLQDEMNLNFKRSQVDMMRTALGRWGEAAQVGVAVEECAELIVALQKHVNRTPKGDTLDNILDEIADVEMMLAQMRLTFGISDEMLHKRIAKKFAVLEKYLKT
jgi:hypothetical protein